MSNICKTVASKTTSINASDYNGYDATEVQTHQRNHDITEKICCMIHFIYAAPHSIFPIIKFHLLLIRK